MPHPFENNEIPAAYKTHLPEENTNSLRETGDFMLEPFEQVSEDIKSSLKRIYRVASQPLTGEPVRPLPRGEYPIEYYASLAARVVAMPLVMMKEALDIGTAARKGSVGLQAGPKGEVGEWTPEQYKTAADVTMTAGMAIGGGMPGGGTGPANIGRKEALKMMAKSYRGLKGKTTDLILSARKPETYRGFVKALKNIPQERLDPVESIGLFAKEKRGVLGTFKSKEKAIRLKAAHRGGDPIETLGHEVIHSEQFRKTSIPIQHKHVPMIEKHAKEAGKIFSETVQKLPKGERITTEGFDEIYRQATKALGTKPYARGEAVGKVTELSLGPKYKMPKKAGEIFETPVGKVKYDASQSWEEGGKVYHQYTIQEGPAKGATFTSTSKSSAEVFKLAENKVAEFIVQGKPKGVEKVFSKGGSEAVGHIIDKDMPKSLVKFATTEKKAHALNNLSDMTLAVKNVASKNTEQMYRPAVRLKDGTILHHPKAKIHSDAITMQSSVKKTGSFDYDSVVGSGGIGPDGHYYESDWMGDALIDIAAKGIEDISGAWGF